MMKRALLPFKENDSVTVTSHKFMFMFWAEQHNPFLLFGFFESSFKEQTAKSNYNHLLQQCQVFLSELRKCVCSVLELFDVVW